MSEKQKSLGQAVETQKAEVARLIALGDELQHSLGQAQELRTEAANDPSAYGGHGNHKLDQAEKEIKSIEIQIETNDFSLQKAQRELDCLLHAQANGGNAAAQEKTQALDVKIQEQQAKFDTLRQRVAQLTASLLDDPDNETLHEDIAIAKEQRAAVNERLNLYQAARAAAREEEENIAIAARVRNAFVLRDEAVRLADERVKVAEKIDKYLAGIGPLMREWREIDNAVNVTAGNALKTVCDGSVFETRQRFMQNAHRIAPPNSIARAVAQELLVANVGDVTRGCLEFRSVSVMEATRNPITAKELAEQTIPRLSAGLDESLRQAGSLRAPSVMRG